MFNIKDSLLNFEYRLIDKIILLDPPPFFLQNRVIRFYIDFWLHIARKHFYELNERYYKEDVTIEKLYKDFRKQFKNKITIPFMDFSLCTTCTLNCKDCTEWIPYIKEKEIYKADKLIKDFETLFKNADYIHFVSPLGGEPFLNPETDKILDYLIKKADEGKIGYIRLVTNGTIYPKQSVLEKFKHPKFSILINNYGDVLNETQQKNNEKLIKYFKENNINYYLTSKDIEWTDFGVYKEHIVSKSNLENTFDTCYIKNCALFINGKLYRCPRVFVLEKNQIEKPKEDDVIDFYKIKNKKELKKMIYKFYSNRYLSACKYCNPHEKRKQIQPAIQL